MARRLAGLFLVASSAHAAAPPLQQSLEPSTTTSSSRSDATAHLATTSAHHHHHHAASNSSAISFARAYADRPARLFCFSVVSPGDAKLVLAQHRLAGGIFGCDEWAVFSNASHVPGLPSDHVYHTISGPMNVRRGGAYNSALNTPLLMPVWRALPRVLAAAAPREFDWVLKLDPDTCFSAARMRSLVRRAAPRADPREVAYAWGLDRGRWIPGPIEVLSHAGVHALASGLDACTKVMEPGEYGEDIFLMGCVNGDVNGDQSPSQPRPSPTPRLVDVIRDSQLLCWHGIYCSGRRLESQVAAYHPAKREEDLSACLLTNFTHTDNEVTCTGTPSCTAALTAVTSDGRLTCHEHVSFLVASAQLTEREACARVAGEFPNECGMCSVEAAHIEASRAAHGRTMESSAVILPRLHEPRNQIMVLRTTASLLLDRSVRANVGAMHQQLGTSLHLLVDTTICGGLACDMEWTAKELGLPSEQVWSYSACDLAARWPHLRWPLFGVDEGGDVPRHDFYGGELRCWLLTKAASFAREAAEIEWPLASPVPFSASQSAGRADVRYAINTCTADRSGDSDGAHASPSDALGLVSYLVHEPSVALWHRAHEKLLDSRGIKHVWVVEQDALFGGSLTAFLNLHTQLGNDLVSLFCPFAGKGSCDDPLTRTTGLPHDTRELANRIKSNSSAVHHWEHVVRFSRRLLETLERSLDDGHVAHGEEFAPTLCTVTHADWCTSLDLRETLSASRYVGTTHFDGAALPQYARWYHTSSANRCEMLLNWSSSRGDAALAERVRAACAPEAVVAMSVPPSGSARRAQAEAEMRPTARLLSKFEGSCERICCSKGVGWCCPTANATHP